MRQWVATTKDGNVYSETENKNWNDIKDVIVKLQLDNNGQIITLPENMTEYAQAKTASAFVGSNNIQIESRYISCKIRNNIVRIRVDENTNNISVEID